MTTGMVSDPTATDEQGEGSSVGAQPARQRSISKGVLNPQYPMSYWQIAFSHDIARESVIPLRVLERDVVLWRDSGGVQHCAAANCVHLGANLGYGGEVVDDTLRCPFHAWRYNGDGKVVQVPGLREAPKTKACLPTYQVI